MVSSEKRQLDMQDALQLLSDSTLINIVSSRFIFSTDFYRSTQYSVQAQYARYGNFVTYLSVFLPFCHIGNIAYLRLILYNSHTVALFLMTIQQHSVMN